MEYWHRLQDIPTVVRYTDDLKIGDDMARLILDCDGVDVITHELIGDLITIGREAQSPLLQTCPRDYFTAAGSSFEMSTTQRHCPSGSMRQTATPRRCVVIGVPFGPGMVRSSVPRT
jgi:hypothetical protein